MRAAAAALQCLLKSLLGVATAHLHKEQVCVIWHTVVQTEGKQHGRSGWLAGIPELVAWMRPSGIEPIKNQVDPNLLWCIRVPAARNGASNNHYVDRLPCHNMLSYANLIGHKVFRKKLLYKNIGRFTIKQLRVM